MIITRTVSLLVFVAFLLPSFAYADDFVFRENYQCSGSASNIIGSDQDVIDGGGLGAFLNAFGVAEGWCRVFTPVGGCCSVAVSTNGAGRGGPAVPYTWFSYHFFQDTTATEYVPPGTVGCLANTNCVKGGANSNNTGRQWKHFAGTNAASEGPGSAITVALVANPRSIRSGESSLLSWTSTNATSCTGTNFNTGGETAGSKLVSPGLTTPYTVTCTNASGSASDTETVTVTNSDGTGGGGSCATGNTCSGNAVINSCTGAVVEECATSCIPGGSLSGGGSGGSGGGAGGGTSGGSGGGSGSGGGGGGSGSGTAMCAPSTGSCTGGPMCFGIDLYYQNSDCSRVFMQSCALGCSSGQCITDAGAGTAPALTFLATPPLIKKGASCQLTFSAQNVTRCELVGKGVSRNVTASGGSVPATSVTTPALITSEKYRLTCYGENVVTKDVECKIAPSFEEF